MTVSIGNNRRQASTMPGTTLVWIDSRTAYVVRWVDGRGLIERIASDVPPHHKTAAHVRHDPGCRMGGGIPQPDLERQRLEHLARFVEQVAQRVPADDDLLLMGPGTVRGHLGRHLVESDRGRIHGRSIMSEPCGPLTERQLIARLRAEIGTEPARGRPIRRASARASEQMKHPPRHKHVEIDELGEALAQEVNR
jgi:hypothetical protein